KASQSGVQVEAHRLQWGPKKAVTSRWGYTAEVQPVITVAKIAADPSHLHFRDAQQILNTDVKTIEAMAKEEGALIAFNGVYFSSHTPPSYYTIGAPVVRDGVVVSQANDSAEWSLLGWNDGRWSREYISGATVQQQLGNGLRFSISDHHVPVEGGQVVYTWPEDGVQPYSMFGQIDASHYVIAIGEYAHRSDVAAACVAYGAQTVVELNGGNCAYLYLKGVGNAPNPGATTNTLKQLNKLNLLFNEEMAMLGIFGGKGMGGPDQSIDMIYFK
ncbi:MAG: hypothetical protein LBB50_04170, partial [Oscillospiraceae bacterium]|nr:hypothetical protein [Oscillospiraceae bacterium]